MTSHHDLEVIYIDASVLNDALSDGDEIALLDVREAGAFSYEHLWLASPLPYSNLELKIRRFIPRLDTRIVLCDDGDGLAEQAVTNLDSMGYTSLRVLRQGIEGWKNAGYAVIDGNYVIAHTFGYFIEEHYGTPVIDASELQSRLDNNESLIIIDTRSEQDYRNASIAGSISVPVAEVARRIPDLVGDSDTTVVVHCAGITRAALGAEALINSGIKNPVVSLIDGTRGWDLVDGELVSNQPIEAVIPSEKATAFCVAAAKKFASLYQLEYIRIDQLNDWLKNNPDRTSYKIDIRSEQEYRRGHYPQTIWIPGGELVGMTIDHLATQHARICLFADQDCARAEITAFWMQQQNWTDVVIVSDWIDADSMVTGPEPEQRPEFDRLAADFVTAEDCYSLMSSGKCLLLDFTKSLNYQRAHIPSSKWASRAQLFQQVDNLETDLEIICTSEDDIIAILAASDLRRLSGRPIKILRGGNNAWIAAGYELTSGAEQMLGTIDDVDKLAPPIDPDRSRIIEWHQQGILWRHGLYEKFKKDQSLPFKMNQSDT